MQGDLSLDPLIRDSALNLAGGSAPVIGSRSALAIWAPPPILPGS